MVGGVLESGRCEEHDWRKFTIHWYVRLLVCSFICFFKFPAPTPKQSPNFCFLSTSRFFWDRLGGDWGIDGTTLKAVER
jgi:hypothetical protein